MTRRTWLIVGGTTLVMTALGPMAEAQAVATNTERFSFTVASASKAGSDAGTRFELTITRWATDAERDRMLSVLKTEGEEQLRDGIRDAYIAGHLKLPGGTQNTVRYARRSPRPDGGEDIVLVFDWRLSPWWDKTLPSSPPDATFSVIQLRLAKNGTGEGKLAIRGLREDKATGIMMTDYESQPPLLLDLKREGSK